MDSPPRDDPPTTPGHIERHDRNSQRAWVDAAGRSWQLTLQPGLVTLADADERIELPEAVWARDIYVSSTHTGYVVRFSTADREVGFLVSSAQAAELVQHLGSGLNQTGDAPVDEADAEETRATIMWPRVSRLAVWALITSAAAFLPVIGFPATVATVILLMMHRKTVRRARAWDHSRRICLAACCFLIAGVPVSITATTWLLRNMAAEAEDAGAPGTAEMSRGTARQSPKAFKDAPRESSSVSHERRAASVPSAARSDPAKVGAGMHRPRKLGGSAPTHSVLLAEAFWERDHNWGLIAAGLVVVLLSLTVHEAAHAITAWWLGDDLALRLGRVTLNPLAHIDPVGTVLLPLILFLSGMGVFGWARPVPVRMDGVRSPRRAHILVSLAGPGSNLLLACGSLLLLLGMVYVVAALAPSATIEHLSPASFDTSVTVEGFRLAPVVAALGTVLKLSFLVNVFLAFFNLIPIPPLDGSWVLQHLFPRRIGPLYERIRPYGLLLFLALIYTNVLPYLLIPAFITLMLGKAIVELCTPF